MEWANVRIVNMANHKIFNLLKFCAIHLGFLSAICSARWQPITEHIQVASGKSSF